MTGTENKTPSQSNISYNVSKIRLDFPIFRNPVNGKPLIYLDNAATTQKPQSVIDALVRFYSEGCASIHRGTYSLSEAATQLFENSREKVRRFINAESCREIIFVRGTTEGINLIAQTYGRKQVGPGDEILISAMEHHSNIVPWQMLCEEKGAKLCVAPIDRAGELVLEEYEKLLGPRTRLVAIAYVSNTLGTINPVREIVALAHRRNIPVLVDGAQAVQHIPVDVQALGCDFFVFSGHKMYGPTGIGVMYGKEQLLDSMPPYQGGGDMVRSVAFEKTSYGELPFKFEAGTPDVAGIIGLGAAVDYLESIGLDRICAYEKELISYGTETLQAIGGLRMIGQANEKAGVLSFVIKGIHPHDIGTLLNEEGIAIRAGHQCAQPVMEFFGVPATARASLGLYNTREEIDALTSALNGIKEVFR
jgi:cysteine desulfurase/selenocysteine lyase